jgi:EmrB/QacA subfamily drug resistance transporter
MSDPAIASPAPLMGVSHANRRWVFVATLVTSFMAAVEGTIVATAMPSIVGTLGGFDLFSWVFTSYLLTQAVTVPIYGRLADLYGRKTLLFYGIFLFLAGSLLCGLAWSMTSLIAFRVVQGLGAGAVAPVSQTLMGDLYRGAERARMQGYISSVFASAALIGPMAGAVIVAHASWSFIFWINIPLGLASALMLALTLREKVERREHRIDYAGSVLMALATGVLMYSLVEASSLGTGALWALVAASLALIVWFAIHEVQTREPLLPLALFRNPIIASGTASSAVSGAMMMGIAAFLPAYMQGAMGTSVLAGGTALMALSAAWPIGGFTASRITTQWSNRTAIVLGGLVLTFGSLMMVALDPTRGVPWVVASTMFMGYGLGLANNTWNVAVQSNVEWNERGIATSMVVFTRIIGQSLGTAIYGGIVNAGLARHMAGAGDLVNRMLDPVYRTGISPAAIAPVMQDFADALHRVYLSNAGLALLVLATALGMPRGLTPQGSSART